MPLENTADFAQPLSEDGIDLFYPYQNGPFTLAPSSLAIATADGDKPAFSLELVQGTQSYGVLDMTLAAEFRMEDALKLVRRKRPGASLEPARFTGGLFRWQPRLESEMPPGFLDPRPLPWNGLGSHRFILKLSKDAAVLVRDALSDATFLLDAIVDVEMEGLAPRVPVRVNFNSSDLLKQIRGSGLVAWEDIVRRFTDTSGLSLSVQGSLDPSLRGLFAEALADRVRARLGTFAAAPPEDPCPHFRFPAEGELPSTDFNWDLSEPLVVRRGFTLRMSTLEIVRRFVKQNGANTFCRNTIVPPLPTGQYSITILFNLAPGLPVNIAAAGATLKAPPVLPYRFQAATASVEVRPPALSASARLRLSPVEKLAFECTTWAALANANGVVKYESDPFHTSDDLLNLGPDAFPIRVISVSADDSLLSLAAVEGTLNCLDGQQPFSVTFRLDDNSPSAWLAVPRRASDCRLSMTAREKGGTGALALPPFSEEAVQLGLYSFREYGPQAVAITVSVPDGQPSVALETIPEGEPDSACQLLLFTPAEQTKTCAWFAKSPFHPGFRYRVRKTFGAPPGPWSDIRQPFEPLVLK